MPADRDLFFEPTDQANVAFFAHIVDQNMTHILARNESNEPVEIPAKLNVGKVTDIGYENCFFGDVPYELAMRIPRSWKTRFLDAAMVAASQILPGIDPTSILSPTTVQHHSVPALPSIPTMLSNVFSTDVSRIIPAIADDGFQIRFPAPDALEKEEKLPNGIMIYGNDSGRKALSDLVVEYPALWIDEGFVDVPQDQWMQLKIRNDWFFHR